MALAKPFELGVCYYPEQWPEDYWARDAQRMVELGLTWVRVAEFAWARLEPEAGRFDWDWLDRAIKTLGDAGLKVIMSTPTAAPPKWLVDAHPDVLPVDEAGRVRKFGARRHYCFSSEVYLAEAKRITRAVAERYGRNPHVHAWQTDNEYGDHETIYSYSPAALAGFRAWLSKKYGTIDALNEAWGTAFWSMTYASFDQIELPNNCVEEPAPGLKLDFCRYASERVRIFNKAQVEILYDLSPGRPVTHNFMNQNEDFDHFDVGADLDIASWDVYPLGGLLNGRLDETDKEKFLRVGDPDQTAFNHALYRAAGKGRLWVMEQQPGPVNWASSNPAPMDGMVRLWTWLAFAQGAEMVSYFRWRQSPSAQEQFHTGLLRPDDSADQAHDEVEEVLEELAKLPDPGPKQRAEVALVVDYPSRWASLTQPQGEAYRAAHIALDWFAAAARLGVEVDLIGQHDDPAGYKLVLAPDLLIPDERFVARLKASGTRVLFGPRSGSRLADMKWPSNLAPGMLADLTGVSVTRVESLPKAMTVPFLFGDENLQAGSWRESISTDGEVLARFGGAYRPGEPAYTSKGNARYLATLPQPEALRVLFAELFDWSGIDHGPDLGDLRVLRRGALKIALNYGPEVTEIPAPETVEVLAGTRLVPQAGVTIWRD